MKSFQIQSAILYKVNIIGHRGPSANLATT